jgi:hypothetical protein
MNDKPISYVNENILKPTKLELIEFGNKSYYKHPENNKLLHRVTSVTSATMPTSPFLIDWIAKHGKEKAEQIKNDRAEYGTIMHVLISTYLLYNEVDVNAVIDNICEFNNYDKSKLNIFELQKDLLSFIQFTIDKEVKAHAIEYQVYNNLFAGTIDLICEMNFNGKRVNAIVDYKSGRNGFYDSHRVQLHAYKSLLNECQNLDVDMVFNFAPKNWRITEQIKPTYDLENQSDAVWSAKWNLYSELFRLDLQQQKETTIKNITLNNIITNDFNNLVTIEEFEVSK